MDMKGFTKDVMAGSGGADRADTGPHARRRPARIAGLP